MSPKTINIFFFLLFTWIGTQIGFAQEENLEKYSIEEAIKYIYTNPQKTLEIGEHYLSKSSQNPSMEYRYLMLLAQAYVMIPDYEKTLEYGKRAYEIAEKNKLYPDQINASTFLGNHYLRLNLDEKAWKSLEQSERILKNHALPDSLGHIEANVYLLKGYLWGIDKSWDKAQISFDKAAELFRKSTNKELGQINLGVAYTHKGRTFLQMNQLDSAAQNFKNVIELNLDNNPNGVVAFAYLSLGEVYQKKEDLEKSNEYLLLALNIAKETKQQELVKEIYKDIADNYLNLNDVENYKLYEQWYKASFDEFKNSETNSVREVAKAAKGDPSSVSTTLIVGLILGILFIILLFFLFMKSYRLKKKMKP
jgi:tetratricopeptide (TPR) repeat protein